MEIAFLDYINDLVLVLIPALYIIGMIIKNIEIVPNKFIPLILLGLAIVGSIALNKAFTADAIIQGIIVTGVTVYGNQVAKQLMSKDDK